MEPINDTSIIILFYVPIFQSLFSRILDTNFNILEYFFLETGTFERFFVKSKHLHFSFLVKSAAVPRLICLHVFYVTTFKNRILSLHICRDLI